MIDSLAGLLVFFFFKHPLTFAKTFTLKINISPLSTAIVLKSPSQISGASWSERRVGLGSAGGTHGLVAVSGGLVALSGGLVGLSGRLVGFSGGLVVLRSSVVVDVGSGSAVVV